MTRLAAFVLALLLFVSPDIFARKIRLGLGFDYIPTAKIEYVRNPELNFDTYDNLIWQGRASYDFQNGFSAGLLFDYLSRTIHPQNYLTTKISLWGVGVLGEYGYKMTESGHALLVEGIESGYGRLKDNSGGNSGSDGSPWVAGIAGLRFWVARNLWLNTEYRLSWMEFGPISIREKKYGFSGSSIRLALDYEL